MLTRRARLSLGTTQLDDRLEEMRRQLDAVSRRVEVATGGAVYLGDHLAIVKTEWGGKLVVDTRDHLLAPHLLVDHYWESQVTAWMQEQLAPGDVVVDVGANIGYYTVLAARLVGPEGRVVAVEAHPEIAPLLTRNVVLNGYHDRVSVFQRAAWHEPGTLAFHRRVHYAANSSVGSVGEETLGHLHDREAKVEVEAARVDDLLEGVGRVDLLKVDVEGSEVRALAGLERTVRANPDLTLMVEWCPAQLGQVGDSGEALVDLLCGYGMSLRLIEAGLAPVDRGDLLQLPYGNVVAGRRLPLGRGG